MTSVHAQELSGAGVDQVRWISETEAFSVTRAS
jgi:hypothetical protein